jgi:septum formation protein
MAFHLVLASASPRRRELLERLGFSVKVMPSSIEEARLDGESPENYVKRMSRAKVLSVVERLQQNIYIESEVKKPAKSSNVAAARREPSLRWIVGADTVVVLGERILEKPKDNNEAFEMLQSLSGCEHLVITGFCIFDLVKNKEGIQAVSSNVKFKRLSKSEIERYLSIGESQDKAGAYAVQGVGAYLIESITGSYTNIVGLPLCQVIEMLEEMGATELLPFIGSIPAGRAQPPDLK